MGASREEKNQQNMSHPSTVRSFDLEHKENDLSPCGSHVNLEHMKFLICIFLLCLSDPSQSGIKKFTTDYCTNFPEGTRQVPELWKHCCLTHDLYFWAGGAKEDRRKADLELRECIENTGALNQSWLMYFAVRAGSYSPIKYSNYKWNNGWNDGRQIRALSTEDIDLIEEELGSGYDFIPGFLKESFLTSLRLRTK